MTAKHPDIRVTLNLAGDDFRIIDYVIKGNYSPLCGIVTRA